MMYKSTPVKELVADVIESQKLTHLGFINPEKICDENYIYSPLQSTANKELSAFLSSLGRSNAETQLDLVDSFRSYMCSEEEKLKISHTKNSRLYLSFGVFSGLLIALIFV